MKTGINKAALTAKRDNLFGKHGEAQTWLDNAIAVSTIDYVPYKDGGLSNSVFDSSDFGSGELIYNTPYAHWHYVKDNPPGTRQVTRPFNHRKLPHHLAGHDWFGRSKEDNLQKWINGMQKNIKSGDWVNKS